MTFRHTLLALCCAAALAACGSQQEGAAQAPASAQQAAGAGSVSVKTMRGEAAVPLNPERVAVYDLGALDTLSALGVKIGAAPNTLSLTYLQDAVKDAVKAGTLFDPNYEALHAYNPQLIVIGGRTADAYDELAKLAPTIEMGIDSNNMRQSADERIDAFGAIFNKKAEADALKQQINASFEAAKAAAAGKGRGLVLMVNGGKLSAFGPKSRLGGWIHGDIGVPAVDEAIKEGSHGQPVSFEYVKEKNPDWLFVLDRTAAIGEEGQAAKDVLNNPLIAETTAWKKGQVVYLLPETYLATGGAQELLNSTKQLKDAFDAAK